MGNFKTKRRLPNQSRGFTLIEILVVVAIIVVLASILIPALGAAKRNAKRTAGTAQLQGLATATEAFYTEFHNLPGPVPVSTFGSGTGLENGFSDSQNLVIALSRRYYVTNPPYSDVIPPAVQVKPIPNTNPLISVALDPTVRPVDRAPYGASTDKPYDAYVNSKPGELTPSVTPNTPLEFFSTFTDSKVSGDPLPILYFRTLRRYDVSTNPAMTRLAVNSSAAAPAVFTTSSNSVLGKFCDSSPLLPAGAYLPQASDKYPAIVPSKLDVFLGNISNTGALHKSLFNESVIGGITTYKEKGAFVLISPGLDRIYGNDSTGKSDDIIVPGGL